MHYRRGPESNFSSDSGLGRPQCNDILIRCGLSDSFDLPGRHRFIYEHVDVNATTVVEKKRKAFRRSLSEAEADVARREKLGTQNSCRLDAKSALACCEPHRLMIDNSVRVSDGGFFH